MKQADLTKLETLFHELLPIPRGAERDMTAARLSDGDPDLARQALDLVESDEDAAAANEAARQAAAEPRIYGRYQTVRLLGSGGMGAVYLAERADDQFRHTVAVKVIAPHAAGENFRERFRAERQILAGLNHPDIPKLLDGGVTPEGTPYVVMEYVDGQPLDVFCDTHKLNLRARLELFRKVCEPVAYAHRNLVVHRDLKPSNILVTVEGAPKLLDFGTAKLLAVEDTYATTVAPLLTLRYSSPEQRCRAPLTTSTDIFSLGVILYEMLTGAWPFGDPSSPQRLLERFTHDTPMTAPQATITETAAVARSSNSAALRSSLAGDLGNILAKAMAPEPERRYETVQALSADIGNWLAGLPVTARHASFSYRTSKFLRRRWLPVAAAVVFVLGLLGSTLFAVNRASHARQEAARAQHIAEFANNLFIAPNAAWYSGAGGKGKDTKLVDVLDLASRRMPTELKGDPDTEFRLRTTLARTFLSLMMLDRADEEARLAASLLPVVSGKQPEAEVELAIARCELFGRRLMWKQAEPLCHDAVVQARRLRAIPNRLLLQAANDWGLVLGQIGNRKGRDAEMREALAAVPHPDAGDLLAVLVVQSNLAVDEVSSGDFSAAASEFRAILAARASLPDTSGESAMIFYNLAFCELFLGELAEAENHLHTALELADASPMGKDPRFAVAPLLLAVTLAAEGKSAQGEEELARIQSVLPKSPAVGTNRLFEELAEGILALNRGQAPQAEQRFRIALETAKQQSGGKNYGAAYASRWLATALEAEGQISAARGAVDDAIHILSQIYEVHSAPLLEAREYAARLSRRLQ
jgi:tetratricopeptide (TPR) repeat protein/predicted Ser/Thr protein kinase